MSKTNELEEIQQSLQQIFLNNMTFIDTEIKKRLTEKKLRYYRQFLQPPYPNNQVPR